MKSAILIGNGFTSQLISNYSSFYMMSRIKDLLPEIHYLMNELFDKFRKKIDVIEYTSIAAGVCGMMTCGQISLYRPITDIIFNEDLKKHIVSILNNYGFKECDKLYDDYFKDYGLIFETQNESISNVESALKVVSLFMRINKFSDDNYAELKKQSDLICYNNGCCEIEHIEKSNNRVLQSYFSQFDDIFTTNYDLLLDSMFFLVKKE